jgi:colanic acid/amylovoran biosynthesis glycosyltransferase
LIRIAHFRKKYLGLSETFIYQVAAHAGKVEPLFFTQMLLPSAIHFPLPRLYLASPEAMWNRQWLWAQLDRKVRNRPPIIGLLARHKARLIHAHFGPDGCIARPWAAELGLPLVTSFYGYDLSKQSAIERWMPEYQILFEQGALFLVEGNHMRQSLARLGCPVEKIQVQRIAIDVQQVPYQERRLMAGEPVRLLFCGRFVEKKGLADCLRAVSTVIRQGFDIHLRVVGDGELRPEVESLIEDLGLGGKVDLLGFIPYSQLLGELNNAQILIAPSLSALDGDSEGGAPVILLDAQANGLPILSTTHADIPEVVVDGQSAYLAPEGDAAALAEGLIGLIMHPEDWPAMGAAGRAHVEKHHDIRVLAPQLEHKYFQVLGLEQD